jgi:hypothetical protein
MVWVPTLPPDSTDYVQTAGMDGETNTDNVTELSAQAVAAALAASTSATSAATSASAAATSAASLLINEVNVTAAGALMDSELTSIADVKALDQSVVSGATPTFGIANMTLDDASLVVAPATNLQTFSESVDGALLRARGTGFTSTYVSTVAIGGTTFAQPAVNGEIHSDQGYFAIAYGGATGITVATLSSPSTYVYIDNAGNLQQQTSTPTRQDWSRKMFTMRIAVDTVAETILGFEFLANPIGHYANSDRDIFTALLAQGVPFKGGQVITGRAGDLGFDVGAGSIMEYGGTGDIHNPNLISLDAVANATYDLLEQSAIAAENQTNLVKSWDNAGTITVLGSGTFVAHRLYRFSNGQFAIQYGQGNYANIVLARAGLLIEDYVLNERLINATFFGWWIIGETAANTGGTTLTEFREYTIGVQGGSSSGLAGCLLKGNNLSDLLDTGAAKTNLGLGTGDSPTFDALDVTGTITSDGLTVDGAFTSLGIDDNATSTAITIDSSENVGIGTSSPSHNLSIEGSGVDIGLTNQNGTTWTIGQNAVLNELSIRSPSGTRLHFGSGGIVRAGADNTQDLGSSSFRWKQIYAGNATINTSDRNEKQDIEEINDAETRVAIVCKGLLRKFRWKSAVAEKGDDARIHFGIIAQDLRDAFAAEGLDANRYGMFTSDTWWEGGRVVSAVDEELDEEGNVVTEARFATTVTNAYDSREEAPNGAVERIRLGVRYPELLAFIIAAI